MSITCTRLVRRSTRARQPRPADDTANGIATALGLRSPAGAPGRPWRGLPATRPAWPRRGPHPAWPAPGPGVARHPAGLAPAWPPRHPAGLARHRARVWWPARRGPVEPQIRTALVLGAAHQRPNPRTGQRSKRPCSGSRDRNRLLARVGPASHLARSPVVSGRNSASRSKYHDPGSYLTGPSQVAGVSQHLRACRSQVAGLSQHLRA